MAMLVVGAEKLLHNFKVFSKTVNCGGNCAVIPVLAANAYGLGATEVAGILYESGVRFFACGSLADAIKIKNHYNNAEVLLLNTYSSLDDARAIVANDIIASIGSYDNGVVLSGMSQELKKEVKFHLKFDTDMARMGFNYDEVQKAIQVAKFLPGLKLCGVYANITSYECKSKKKAEEALTKFKSMLSLLKRDEIDLGLVHLAGTVGALKYPSLRLGAVRCGSALAGDIKIKDKWGFKKVSRLVSSISDIRWVPQKQKIGINYSYKTKKSTKIAIVNAGYRDGVGVGIINEPYKLSQGFSRIWKNIIKTVRGRKFYCDINGKKARIIGRADFETLIIDVTKVNCKPGDIVSLEVNPLFINSNIDRSYV